MWELHIQHEGLRASRVLQGRTQDDAQWKASIQLRRWEARWAAQQQREAERKMLLTRQWLAIHGHSTAASLSAELDAQRLALDTLLAASLKRGRFLHWNHLRDTTPFPCVAALAESRGIPAQLALQQVDPDDPGLLDKLLPSRRARREMIAGERFARDLAAWQVASAVKRRCTAAETQTEERCRHRAAQNAQHAMVEQTKSAFYAHEENAVAYFFTEALSRSFYPLGFPEGATLQYIRPTRTLVVDYELPSLSAWPTHRQVIYNPALNALQEVPDATNWRKVSYDDALAQIALRVLSELFTHDDPCCLERIAFNGYVRAIDRSTGNLARACVLSMLVGHHAFKAINLAQVDPIACFRRLKGVASANLFELSSVRPLLARSEEADATEEEAAHPTGPTSAAMNRLDFEGLAARSSSERPAGSAGKLG